MVCIICYESMFKAPPGRRPRDRSSDTTRPCALSCGHAFHRDCIQEWFSTSERNECPMCHKQHRGALLALFIEADEAEAPETRRENRPSPSAVASADVEDLYVQLGGLSLADDMAFMSAYGHSMYLQEEMNAMENENQRLESNLDNRTRENRNLKDKNMWLMAEVDRLKRLSEAHKTHIASLQRNLEDKKRLLEDHYISY
ncbi:hypothetical protein GGF46_005282 [Coemansia sp. RSA 552]|nr:hypothetical protein GGF46_005282 [Coemansia sp. RSA 552]